MKQRWDMRQKNSAPLVRQQKNRYADLEVGCLNA